MPLKRKKPKVKPVPPFHPLIPDLPQVDYQTVRKAVTLAVRDSRGSLTSTSPILQYHLKFFELQFIERDGVLVFHVNSSANRRDFDVVTFDPQTLTITRQRVNTHRNTVSLVSTQSYAVKEEGKIEVIHNIPRKDRPKKPVMPKANPPLTQRVKYPNPKRREILRALEACKGEENLLQCLRIFLPAAEVDLTVTKDIIIRSGEAEFKIIETSKYLRLLSYLDGELTHQDIIRR